MLPGQRHFKNPKTMKHFFLWAVAISALCSSCETADESFVENNNRPEITLLTQHRTVSDYDAYTNVINSFTYDNSQSHYNNQLQFEQHVNNSVPNGITYEAINFSRLDELEHADTAFVNQLNYSLNAKTVIIDLINGTFNTNSLTSITNTDEHRLITTLYAIHHNGNGDDEWKNNRTIAFAYGAQFNLTQAILYSGAVDLVKNKD